MFNLTNNKNFFKLKQGHFGVIKWQKLRIWLAHNSSENGTI